MSMFMKLCLRFSALVCALAFFVPVMTQAATADAAKSSIRTDKTSVNADGIDQAQITVTLKDINYMEVRGVAVSLVSSRGALDEVMKDDTITDSLGKARFRVSSLKNGTSTFTVVATGQTMANLNVAIAFGNGLSFPLQPGDLIKIPDDGDVKTLNDTAVYYYATNGKRYVFPNEKTYFTWYENFAPVKIIPIDQMSLVPIGGNVTYRPGTRMVKFQTDTKTYIVTRGGVLRWAKTEEVARGWFGNNWNQSIDDISEGFYINYKFGDPVNSPLDLALDIIKTGTRTIDQDKGLVTNF